MPAIKLPEKILPLLEKKKRFKVLVGGRGSGKSISVALLLLMKVQTTGAKVLCAREFQNSIDDSVKALLCELIYKHELTGFTITNARITHENGGEFIFKGLARNPESLKSLAGVNYAFVEEAQTISDQSLRALTPTIREEDSEIWFVGNPRSSADPFSQKFLTPYTNQLERHGVYEDDLHYIAKVNWSDNPFFPEVLRQEMEHDRETLNQAVFAHIWEGHFNDSVDNSIIPVEHFNAALDAHERLGFKAKGAIIASYDPADLGGDAKGYCLRQGSVILEVKETVQGDVNQATDWAIDLARTAKADIFTYDADGLGAGLRRQIAEGFSGTKTEIVEFKGSSGPDNSKAIYSGSKTNADTFRNKRAQYYWRLRDKFAATYRAVEKGEYIDPEDMISISTAGVESLDALRAEVCRIPRKLTNSGMIELESKPKMRALGISSPNMADAVMMGQLVPDLHKQTDFSFNYQTLWS